MLIFNSLLLSVPFQKEGNLAVFKALFPSIFTSACSALSVGPMRRWLLLGNVLFTVWEVSCTGSVFSSIYSMGSTITSRVYESSFPISCQEFNLFLVPADWQKLLLCYHSKRWSHRVILCFPLYGKCHPLIDQELRNYSWMVNMSVSSMLTVFSASWLHAWWSLTYSISFHWWQRLLLEKFQLLWLIQDSNPIAETAEAQLYQK